MTKPIRTFVSVSVPASTAIERLLEKIERMGDAFRPVRKNQLHLTLKFLGETSPQLVPEITQAIGETLIGLEPFEMKLEGAGVFPHRHRPTIFWVGVENAKALNALAKDLEDRFEELGFLPERREFSPHLTIARIRKKPPAEFFELLDSTAEKTFGTVCVDRVELMQSQLSADGPEYVPLATIPLV